MQLVYLPLESSLVALTFHSKLLLPWSPTALPTALSTSLIRFVSDVSSADGSVEYTHSSNDAPLYEKLGNYRHIKIKKIFTQA